MTDHPHVCGEDDRSEARRSAGAGSPPRVWGRPRGDGRVGVSARITPTCVGKTPRSTVSQPWMPDHPHVCGEDRVSCAPTSEVPGSPPRVWGRPRNACRHMDGTRIPPTCVGKTWCDALECREIQDHPHVCGEDRKS